VQSLDPLYVANEGKLVAIVSADLAEALVARMKENKYGAEAGVIGDVKAEPGGIVSMRTALGGTRIVDMLVGEQLPRIC
jgi:hydrogenase expression/formation protein HypE